MPAGVTVDFRVDILKSSDLSQFVAICHNLSQFLTKNCDKLWQIVTNYNIEFILKTKDIVFPDFGLWIRKLMIYYHTQYQYQSLPIDKGADIRDLGLRDTVPLHNVSNRK